MFANLTPLGRSRLAFFALLFALYLIAADRTLDRNAPEVILWLGPPVVTVMLVGHAEARELFLRAALSIVAMLVAALIAVLARGIGLPVLKNLPEFGSALTGLFTMNLVLIGISSAIVRRLWPASNDWTR